MVRKRDGRSCVALLFLPRGAVGISSSPPPRTHPTTHPPEQGRKRSIARVKLIYLASPARGNSFVDRQQLRTRRTVNYTERYFFPKKEIEEQHDDTCASARRAMIIVTKSEIRKIPLAASCPVSARTTSRGIFVKRAGSLLSAPRVYSRADAIGRDLCGRRDRQRTLQPCATGTSFQPGNGYRPRCTLLRRNSSGNAVSYDIIGCRAELVS